MDQLHDNLNKIMEWMQLKSRATNSLTQTTFWKFYKRPEAGSITQTHNFSMDSNEPGVLRLQDDTEAEVRVPKLKKGKLTNAERKKLMIETLEKITPMMKP